LTARMFCFQSIEKQVLTAAETAPLL